MLQGRAGARCLLPAFHLGSRKRECSLLGDSSLAGHQQGADVVGGMGIPQLSWCSWCKRGERKKLHDLVGLNAGFKLLESSYS